MKNRCVSSLSSLAADVIALGEQEYDRRIAVGESNHVDHEEHLLPRWRGLMANGNPGEVLRAGFGYLQNQRVNFRPTNPKYFHETSPNADRADVLLDLIRGTPIGQLHLDVQARLSALHAGVEAFLPDAFIPIHSCYRGYARVYFDGNTVVLYKLVSFDRFCCYVLTTPDEVAAYDDRTRVAGIRQVTVFAT